jgi:hypothetical protein
LRGPMTGSTADLRRSSSLTWVAQEIAYHTAER